MATTPKNNGRALDTFNDQLRASPVWQNFMRRNGFDVVGRPGLVPKLSSSQREALKRELAANGVQFTSGMEIDPSGNVNQDQGVSAAWNNPWIRYPVLAGAAVTGLGAAGIGPLSGAFGGGAAASSAMPAAWGFETAGLAGPGAAGMLGGAGAAGATGATGAGMAGGGFFPTLGKFLGSYGGAQAINAAGNLIGAGLQSRAMGHAADLQNEYNLQALDFLKQQDARDFAEYQKEREREWRFQDEREARLAPFRQNASQGYQTLSSLLFNPNQRMPARTGSRLADLVG